MKTKPTRHKETNTFKFKPFAERINDIDVDVFHKISHRNEEVSEETETFFYQCLQKWNYLNLSGNYHNLRSDLKDIITLPQLLIRKQYVIDVLIKYLKLKDPLILQTVFDLVIAVAKDLQLEFYPYFPEFLATIIDLLQMKDAEQLEHILQALAYFFKFLWRYMIKNIDKIFNLLVPLLADKQPDYVNNFAAESFSFVVRKVKDKPAFLKLVLETVEKRQDGMVGCGKLLFHVVAGVPGQFHSCAETMLGIYFDALQDSTINQQLLFEILSTVFKCIRSDIHPKKCSTMWTVIHRVLEKFPENCLIIPLQLSQIVINYKGGQMIGDSVSWVKILINLIDKYKNNNILLEEITNTCVATLLGSNVQLLQETTSFLILKLLSIDNEDLLLKIIEKLIVHSSFETLILPQILKKSTFSLLSDELLELFVKIIELKSPPTLSGINLKKWNIYKLNIRGPENTEFIIKHLDSLKEGTVTENALKMLVILPHLKLLHQDLYSKLTENFIALFKRSLTETTQQQSINLALLLATECIIRICKPEDFYNIMEEHFVSNFDSLLSTISRDNDVSLLNTMDLAFTYLADSSHSETYINKDVFDKLHESLASKLGSSNSLIRLTTSHIFSLFSSTICPPKRDSKLPGVLELPYLAECEPATVHKYRNRLLHVQALEFNQVVSSGLDPRYHDLPLHHLFGSLYINFSLIWDHVCRVIVSYATRDCSCFWPVFLNKLKSDEETTQMTTPSLQCDALGRLADRVFTVKDKIDSSNYKLLVWKCMAMMGQFCEVKNRDFVGLFIDFVQGNFFKSNSELARSCNIKKRTLDQQQVETDLDITEDAENAEEDEDSEEEKEESKEEKEDTEKSSKDAEEEAKLDLSKKERTKLLLAMLQVFGKFTNPRSLYREPEILQIYLDLLSSKHNDVQKAALNCLYTYKHVYLLPYRSQLDSIVDEKNLKNELTRFQISADAETVLQEEHRADFMSVLMRILHVKMTQRVGMRTGGKAGGLVKRKTILRFLAGVRENEMMVFVHMAFKPFLHLLPTSDDEPKSYNKDDLPKMVSDILAGINLESVIPPKRLQSAVNLLSIMIEQFGGKMSTQLLPYLLGLLVCILAQVVGIINRSNDVHSGFLSAIREVRNSCIRVLGRFFEHFEAYDWSTNEIDAIFEVAVFPWIDKLHSEGIHSPTPLLKMLAVWSHNPRYYPLFVKLNKNGITPLSLVVKLLMNPKTKESVLNTILDMFEKMLTLQDFEKEDPDQMEVDEDKPKSLLPTVANKLDIVKDDSINYGSAILLPHVTDILSYIEQKLIRQKRKGASRTDMIILSRISEFTSDPKTCDTLLTLVLPILLRKSNGSEEVVTQLFVIVLNLMTHVEEPRKHLRATLQLLGRVNHAPARRQLMEVLDKVAKNDQVLQTGNKLLVELNAFDKRWIDQPDIERRLNAYKAVDQLIKDDKITLELGVAIILNSFYFLQFENDVALQDRAGECLKSVGVYLAKKYKTSANDRKYLVDETILSTVRRGLRSTSDNVKYQAIGFLGHMAMECADVHPVFRDLNPLTNKQDFEVDFFENIRHIQTHRRARALQKFCNIAKDMKKTPDTRTLTHFILPLASSYLCNEKYSGNHNLIHDAIRTIGVICRLLPWNQYEVILKHYLFKLRTSLEFQKQIINIVIMILDSFHFDLSKLKDETLKLEETETSIKEKVTKVETEQEQELDSKPSEEIEKDAELEDTEETSEERLDEALETIADEQTEDAVAEEPEKKEIPIMEMQTVLSPYMAKKLIYSIKQGLLPELHKALSVRTKHEGNHKANKRKISIEREEEELMRVPIALPMVKLLQKLPQGLLNSNLRAIFTKVCTFLKSHLESVRRETRDNLKKIMDTVGPNHLYHLLDEMKSLLTRGFQVHVLAFTIHKVLEHMKPMLEPVHIHKNLSNILSVCKVDLFGLSAEEKEVVGIGKHVSEAKSTKSYGVFHVLGECIDAGLIDKVMEPLKEVLLRTHSYKNVKKITECFRQFGLGLADNKFINIEELLKFLLGNSSEYIPKLLPENKKKEIIVEKEEKKKLLVEPQDYYLVPAAPKRLSVKDNAKISKDTNTHVMVEFGLMLFHILLKRSMTSNPELKTVLNDFVPLLNDSLRLQQVKLNTLAIQCLRWLVQVDLPFVNSLATEISNQIIQILHKYGGVGLNKGENYDLKMVVYKTMSVIEEGVKSFKITHDQLKVLLIYVERDLLSGEKHAFSMLRAIIKRKREAPEVHLAMEKVRELMVTSDLDTVQKQAQAIILMYLKKYKLGKKFHKYIVFFLTQLKYELKPGRLSVISMIYKIIALLKIEKLQNNYNIIFEKLGMRLIEDEDPTCREECAKCISKLLERIERKQRDQLFNEVITWFKDKEISKKELAAQLCSIFVIVEKDKFESRLEKLLPILTKQFYPDVSDDEPGAFVKMHNDINRQIDKTEERAKDHHLIQVLELLLDICTNCSKFVTDAKYQECMDNYAEYCQQLLRYPHLWVRIRATRFLGYVLASVDIKKLVQLINNPEDDNELTSFMYSNPSEKLRSLILDFRQLFLPETEFESFERQIIENLNNEIVKHLVFIAKILNAINVKNEKSEAENENNSNELSLRWLMKKLKEYVNREVVKAPKSTIIRSSIFKWMAGAIKVLGAGSLRPMLSDIMLPLTREMVSTEEWNEPLRRLAKDVAKMIKKEIGIDEYTLLLNKAKQSLDTRRALRKKEVSQQLVVDPVIAARRKIARQQKKKEAKKRKMSVMKGKRSGSGRKKAKLEEEIHSD